MYPPIQYIPNAIDYPTQAFNRLWNELEWDRRGSTPRREYYCNDVNVPYTYGSGAGIRTYEPRPLHPVISQIKADCEFTMETKFEVVFLNGYENSRDHLGWHADDSPEMDDSRPICIVSLGAEREIWFRPQNDANDVTKLVLQHGSLCIMEAGMQDTYYHRIPKAGFECGPRISITLRGYVASN